MNYFKAGSTRMLFVLLALCTLVPISTVKSQNQRLEVQIEAQPILENSQLIGLTNLGLDSEGRGQKVVSGLIRNLTNEVIDNLYFEVKVSAGKVGVILTANSRPGYPFSLDPMQLINIDNNTLSQEEFPGIEENVKIDGGLTPLGDEFIESLDGSTTLPADIYSIEVVVFQVTNENGRVDLASAQEEIGGSVPFVEAKDIFLRVPGDVIDAAAEITNPFPQFSWDEEIGIEYRLIVVKGNANDSPETLLQSARSTAPVSEGGNLLQDENLDVNVVGGSFQFPSSGAQPLEPGRTYYWQISTTVQSGLDTEERTSEIWAFKLAEPSSADAPVVVNEETKEILQKLIGNATFSLLVESGYTLQSFEIDGVTYQGNQAAIILADILRKIEDGDIVLDGGN